MECKRCNYPLLPQGITGLIIGKSEYVKTTLLINLLLHPDWLDYNNINVFGKSMFQPEYHILKKAFEERYPNKKLSDFSKTKTKSHIWVFLLYFSHINC